MNHLPPYIAILFIATAFVTVLIFYVALKNATVDAVKRKSNAILGMILLWFIVQAVLAFNGFTKTYISLQKKCY